MVITDLMVLTIYRIRGCSMDMQPSPSVLLSNYKHTTNTHHNCIIRKRRLKVLLALYHILGPTLCAFILEEALGAEEVIV